MCVTPGYKPHIEAEPFCVYAVYPQTNYHRTSSPLHTCRYKTNLSKYAVKFPLNTIRAGFEEKSFRLGFVVDKVALGHILLP